MLAEGFGIHLPASRGSEFVGVADRAMIEQIAAEQIPARSAEELWPSYLRKRALFQERVAADPPIRPETVRLLECLKNCCKLAVVSSSDRSEIEPPLKRANIYHWFQTLVCGTEVRHLKPAPDPYLRAAELLGARHPLVVEDSETGAAAGLAAGFEVLRLSSPQALEQELTELLARAHESRNQGARRFVMQVGRRKKGPGGGFRPTGPHEGRNQDPE